MSKKQPVVRDELDDRIVEAFEAVGNKLSEIANRLGVHRSTVYSRLRRLGLLKKPITEGSLDGMTEKVMPLPKKGCVKRYIITSAQNNTYLNEEVWSNLKALADHYGAKILIGTYSYNQNKYGALAVKRGTAKAAESKLWYDKKLKPYFSDKRLRLAHGLVWCGEMNILPTANDPLEGLETYSGRQSAIFPHAKMAMRSIATMKGEGTKLNYTTGTVTLMNYIQKKAGLKGEHHHVYGAVLVEVNHNGNWWVRQLEADRSSAIYDLNLLAANGKVTTGHRVEAITWGDHHAACIDGSVTKLALGADGMLETLKPQVQFIHDLLEGVSINHHTAKNCHELFKAHLRGFDSVEAELKVSAGVLDAYTRKFCKTVVVDSNHDGAWLYRWLREHDYRTDPQNAMLFLEMQLAAYKALNTGQPFNILAWAINRFPTRNEVKFLDTDESFKTCDGGIENGMHGHLGPNGARGTAMNLNKIGRRANTGHSHSTGIWNGLYVAGTSSNLDMGYNNGPSSWTHSHVITYPNGKRSIVTMYADQWRA